MKKETQFWNSPNHPLVGGRYIGAGSSGNAKQFLERHPEDKVKPKKKWL